MYLPCRAERERGGTRAQFGQARLGLDKPDFLVARAPQPTMVTCMYIYIYMFRW